MNRQEIRKQYGLTEKEFDVLAFAYEHGYFEPGSSSSLKPKNLPSMREMAGLIGIDESTLSHQLANARRKILKRVCTELFCHET